MIDYALEVKNKTTGLYEYLDVIPNYLINFELDFYDVDNIDKIKVPTSTNVNVPLTDNNARILGYNPHSEDTVYNTIPVDPFEFRLRADGTYVLSGNLYVESISFNSAEEFYNVRLQDKMQEIFSDAKNLEFAALYDDYNSNVFFDAFLATNSGTLSTNPTYSAILWPHIDLNNDISKFGWEQRQFTQYGYHRDAVGFIPAFSVKQFISRFFAEVGAGVTSRFFQLGSYGTAISGFTPEKLYAIVPTKLQALSRTNTREINFHMSDRDLYMSIAADSYASSISTVARTQNTYPVQPQGWNYNFNASETTTLYGLDKKDPLPNTSTNEFNAWFGTGVAFVGRAPATSQYTNGSIYIELPMVQTGTGLFNMVKQINLAQSNAEFIISAVIWKDRRPYKKLRLFKQTTNEVLRLPISAATVVGMDIAKYHDQQAFEGKLTTGGFAPIDVLDENPYITGTWNNRLQFDASDIGNFYFEQEDVEIDAGSLYAISYTAEIVSGSINCAYDTSYTAWTDPYDGHTVAVQASSATGTFQGDKFVKQAIYLSSNARSVLSFKLAASQPFNPQFTNDEVNVYQSIAYTSTITPVELLSEIIKRFNLSVVYDQNSQSVLIDRLVDIRQPNAEQNITDLVDDAENFVMEINSKTLKSIELKNGLTDLYYDDSDKDGKTDGSGTVTVNQVGSEELKFTFDSRAYNKSLCGDAVTDFLPFGVSESEYPVSDNVFSRYNDIGVSFGYIDKPLYSTTLKYPEFSYKPDVEYRGLVYKNFANTHIFQGRVFNEITGSMPLNHFDSVGTTTDLYNFFVGNDNIVYLSKSKIKFSGLLNASYAFNIKGTYSDCRMYHIKNNRIVIKSINGTLFDGGIYGDIEAIIL